AVASHGRNQERSADRRRDPIGRGGYPGSSFSQKNPGSGRSTPCAALIRQIHRCNIFQDHPRHLKREVNGSSRKITPASSQGRSTPLPYVSVFQEDPRPLKFDDMGGYMVVNPLIAADYFQFTRGFLDHV